MKMPINIMPSAEPNVTPMIDVLLVLLIVFMLVAIRVHRTIDTQLPQTCAGVVRDPSRSYSRFCRAELPNQPTSCVEFAVVCHA